MTKRQRPSTYKWERLLASGLRGFLDLRPSLCICSSTIHCGGNLWSRDLFISHQSGNRQEDIRSPVSPIKIPFQKSNFLLGPTLYHGAIGIIYNLTGKTQGPIWLFVQTAPKTVPNMFICILALLFLQSPGNSSVNFLQPRPRDHTFSKPQSYLNTDLPVICCGCSLGPSELHDLMEQILKSGGLEG